MHRVHVSILDPEFVDNDITFINFAFASYIERVGAGLSPTTAWLMVEFHDIVPEALRPQLSWHPSPELRRLAESARALPEQFRERWQNQSSS